MVQFSYLPEVKGFSWQICDKRIFPLPGSGTLTIRRVRCPGSSIRRPANVMEAVYAAQGAVNLTKSIVQVDK